MQQAKLPKEIAVKMFQMAVSKVSWKWAASFSGGIPERPSKSSLVFSTVPLPTVSPNETSQHPIQSNFSTTHLTCDGSTYPSKGQPITIETYPLTLMLFFFAVSTTGKKRQMLSLIEQLRFFFENPSVAEAKIAISLTPIQRAASMPFELGTRQGQLTLDNLSIC